MSGVHTAVVLVFFAWAVSGATIREARQLLRSPCPEGSFLKKHDQTCMACDENCAIGCVDEDGCNQCKPGFYTSRADNSWPFLCEECKIENCITCRSGIFDAWDQQCVECAAGYVQGKNRKSCDPDGSVGGEEVVKEVAIDVEPASTTEVGGVSVEIQAGVSVGSEPSPTPPEEETVTCPEGTFVKTKDNSCMDCDGNCVDGGCTDGIGCSECKPGYFRSAVDPFWPFECKECTIENCEVCEDAVFDAWPKFCTKCVDGYEVTDRTTCSPIPEPVVEPTPEPVVEPTPEPVVEPTPEPVVEGTPVPEEETATCPEGTFVKTKDNSCMDCDGNCVDGGCTDGIGCSECKPGYFRSAVDPFWPFECKECTIENCEVCEDAVFDAWPKFCTKCVDGYEVTDRTTCSPIPEPVVEPTPEPVVEPTPEPVVEPTPEPVVEPTPEPVVEPTPAEPSPAGDGEEACPEGYFREMKQRTCMKCDDNCASCADAMGCTACKPGTNTYRSRHDPFWPFSCVSCPIENCLQCVDGVFDTQPVRCAVCGNGTSRYEGGTACT